MHEQPLATVRQQFAAIAARQLSELSGHPGIVDLVSRFPSCARGAGALRAGGLRIAPAGPATYEPTATLRGLAELPVSVRQPHQAD
ncbi:hypothetical protein ACH4OY_24570 [Micromonospora rubida]|uniref:Uncharacterized protein n=1 Tax=Micromonospora rubida TaxID=2697657 RepID=A0ABW7SQ49_9ACTN